MTLTVSISVPLRLLWGGAMAPPAPGSVAAFYAGRQPVDGTAVLARAEAATPSAHCTAVLARRRGRDPFSSLYRRPGAAPRPRPLQLIVPPSWRGAEAALPSAAPLARAECFGGGFSIIPPRARRFDKDLSDAVQSASAGAGPGLCRGFRRSKPKENSAGPALLPSSSRVVYV